MPNNGILWEYFSQEQRQEYIHFLKIFGALSFLFKDKNSENNAKKPYLYYRNHEQLFVRTFQENIKDITRSDSAFDVIANFGDQNFGIGLKTWFHKDVSFQKVAEFDKIAKDELQMINNDSELINRLVFIRNERILKDIRLRSTSLTDNVYHYITRSDNQMNIFETGYELIDPNAVVKIKNNGRTRGVEWLDKEHNRKYRYNSSKSTIMEQFIAPLDRAIVNIPITLHNDPFELLKLINLSNEIDSSSENTETEIYLPLYNVKKADNGLPVAYVTEGAGINKWHRPKSENRLWDVELRVPKWIHKTHPGWFFGYNFLNTKNHDTNIVDSFINKRLRNGTSKNYVPFTLRLPSGREIKASINGQNGKNIQSTSSKELGIWLLKDVLGLTDSDMTRHSHATITIAKLHELNVGSVRLRIIDEQKKIIAIDIASSQAFEDFAKSYNRSYINYNISNANIEGGIGEDRD